MNQYYKKIDWSQCPQIERYPENANRNKMDIEIPEEYRNVILGNSTESNDNGKLNN